MKSLIKFIIFIKALKGGLGYLFLFIFMISLIFAYPLYFQDYFFELLRKLPVFKSRLDLLYQILNFLPLIWMSFVGLISSLINTILYSIIDIDKNEKRTNMILSLVCMAFVCWMVTTCIVTYYKLAILLQNSIGQHDLDSNSEIIRDIQNTYLYFSNHVTLQTFFTFFLFLIIDIKDIFKTKKRLKQITNNTISQICIIEKKYSYLQLFLIDIPVLLSCSIITLYGKDVDESLCTLNISFGHMFTHIFSAGAWGMQIIFSQVVFFFLMMFYCIEKSKIIKTK